VLAVNGTDIGMNSVPAAKEFSIHCAIADVARRWCSPDWAWTHLPFGERRSAITGARLKKMGVNRGWPDFVFVGPGRVIWLDLKRHGGRPTPEQAAIGHHLKTCGFIYEVADSFDAAVTTLRMHGILRVAISAGMTCGDNGLGFYFVARKERKR
jgi:hypothetical protein